MPPIHFTEVPWSLWFSGFRVLGLGYPAVMAGLRHVLMRTAGAGQWLVLRQSRLEFKVD